MYNLRMNLKTQKTHYLLFYIRAFELLYVKLFIGNINNKTESANYSEFFILHLIYTIEIANF